jgi:hypothetical protein
MNMTYKQVVVKKPNSKFKMAGRASKKINNARVTKNKEINSQ